MTRRDRETKPIRDQLVGSWSLLRLVPEAGRGPGAAMLAVLALDALAPILFTLATGLLVAGVEASVRGGRVDGASLAVRLALVGVILVLERTAGPVREAAIGAFSRSIDRRLRQRVMAAALAPSGVAHLEDPKVLDLVELSRGVSVWGGSPGLAVAGLLVILAVRVSGLAALVVLAGFRWWLAVLMGLVAWLVLRSKARVYLLMSTEITSRAEDLRRSRYLRDLVLSPDAAKEVRIFGLGAWLGTRFNRDWTAAMADVWQARGRRAPAVVVTMLLRGGVALLALVLIAQAAVERDISLAAAVVFAQAVDRAAVLSFTLGNPELLVQQGLASVTPAFELERTLTGPNDAGAGGAPAAGLPADSIRFEAVRFTYAGRERPVFEGLDLRIEAGTSLAIVGDNGAGKTTLVKLLCGLYEPDGGRILIDDVDLRALDPRAWHRQIGAIFQDFSRFPLSVAENIGWGAQPDRDDAALREVAAQAGILDAVERLDHGFDTILSREYTGGADLSGGQWQRIALARALYATRAGAKVLVLDEPTAHLDVRAEAALYDRFLALTHGLTTVVVSHRFSTVRLADRIVVIEHGRVVESGTHRELVDLDGRYAKAFSLQAARFSETDQ